MVAKQIKNIFNSAKRALFLPAAVLITDESLSPALSPASKNILFGLAICVGIIVLLAVLSYWRNMRSKDNRSVRVTDAKSIARFMNMAIEQRSTFDLFFPDADGKRHPTVRCTPLLLKRNELIIAAPGIKDSASYWTGRPVSCYFRVQVQKQRRFYHFNGTIRTVAQQENGDSALYIPLPTVLENRQKRTALRFAPPEEYLVDVAIWFGLSVTPDRFTESMLRWPKPRLIWQRGRKGDFELCDLSSGGLRVHIAKEYVTEGRKTFAVAEPFIVRLVVHDPEKNQNLCFLLYTQVRSSTEYDANLIETGLEIMAWFTDEQNGRGEAAPFWRKLKAEGEVDLLGNWIMRRHLEVFREVPGDLS